jgi:hypothetical protein
LESGSLTAVLKAMFGRDTELWKRRTQDSQRIYTSVEKFDYTGSEVCCWLSFGP